METSKNKIRFTILAIVLITVFCFAITPVTFQNDTYYTIKIGEHILNNGIDMKDPFSWHNDLKYTYPHWLYDLLTYLVYSIGGFTGIYVATIILTIILGITLYITNSKLTKNRLISLILTFGILYVIQDFIAARAQLVTFILFVLTVYFIEKFLETKKKRYAVGLIIIPILIANLHAAVFPFYFILYLPYIAEYIFYCISNIGTYLVSKDIKKMHIKIAKENDPEIIEEIKNKITELQEKEKRIHQQQEKIEKNAYKIKMEKNKNIKYLVIVMFICAFTGLLTPIGNTPYTYLIKTMAGKTMEYINEHGPLVLAENVNMMIIVVIFISILTFTDTKIRLSDLFMLAGLSILTFYSKRQESMFAIICCGFVLNKLICEFINTHIPDECIKIENWITSLVGTVCIIAIVVAGSILLFKPKMDDKYVSESSYPILASEFILENLDIENIKLYNEYNYGSYLLFRGIPVFIDSRADLYSPEFNENITVFDDFMDLSNLSISNIENKLDKYGITHLIMYKNAKLRKVIKNDTDKYTLIYEDPCFCIYERKTANIEV